MIRSAGKKEGSLRAVFLPFSFAFLSFLPISSATRVFNGGLAFSFAIFSRSSSMIMVQGTVCLTILLSLVGCLQAAASCYYPDGSSEPGHVPCNQTISGESACCDPLDSCSVSGFCLGRSGFVYRGSCTDPTYNSGNCANQFDACVTSKLLTCPVPSLSSLKLTMQMKIRRPMRSITLSRVCGPVQRRALGRARSVALMVVAIRAALRISHSVARAWPSNLAMINLSWTSPHQPSLTPQQLPGLPPVPVHKQPVPVPAPELQAPTRTRI